MHLAPPKRTLRIPGALVATMLGCAVVGVAACQGAAGEPRADASILEGGQDSGLVDGCIYQLCSGPSKDPSCPGVVCLPPDQECPDACQPAT